jgi:hypothetical protein
MAFRSSTSKMAKGPWGLWLGLPLSQGPLSTLAVVN